LAGIHLVIRESRNASPGIIRTACVLHRRGSTFYWGYMMATKASSESLCKKPPLPEVQIEPSGANVQSNEPTVAHPRNGTAPAHPVNPQAPSGDSWKKPPLSQRKIEANRQNSSDSTGSENIRRERGTRRVTRKHGLFAAEVVNLAQERVRNVSFAYFKTSGMSTNRGP